MESPFRQDADYRTDPDFRLIETLGWRPGQGFDHLDRHLARMGRSAQALELRFDVGVGQALLQTAIGDQPLRCRLTLDPQGQLDLTTSPLGATADQWILALAPQRLQSQDPWLRHKTTRRAVYDQARAALPRGVDEFLFLNQRGELCEGTITNLFVTLQNGQMVTPPLSSGVLPGILRESLLASGKACESILTQHDLQYASQIHMGNSLRGLIPARLVDTQTQPS